MKKTILKLTLLTCLSVYNLAYANQTFSVENKLNSIITFQTDPTSSTTLSFDRLEVPTRTTLDNIAHYELDDQGHAQVKFSIVIAPNEIIYVEKDYTQKDRSLSCSTSAKYRSNGGTFHFIQITNELCSGSPKIIIGP